MKPRTSCKRREWVQSQSYSILSQVIGLPRLVPGREHIELSRPHAWSREVGREKPQSVGYLSRFSRTCDLTASTSGQRFNACKHCHEFDALLFWAADEICQWSVASTSQNSASGSSVYSQARHGNRLPSLSSFSKRREGTVLLAETDCWAANERSFHSPESPDMRSVRLDAFTVRCSFKEGATSAGRAGTSCLLGSDTRKMSQGSHLHSFG